MNFQAHRSPWRTASAGIALVLALLATFGAIETTRAASARASSAAAPGPVPGSESAASPPSSSTAQVLASGPAPEPCDVPAALELWHTCDPVPRTRDAWDDALASGRAAMLELSSNPRARLRVDGRNYGIYVGGDARVTRVPVSPGAHALDFIDDENVVGVRRVVDLHAGETKRIVLEQRDALPRPAAPGAASWYVGRVAGRPSYTNITPETSVSSLGPPEP